VVAAALVVVSSASASGQAVEPPAPETLPQNLVAVVSHVPEPLGRITQAEFQRALAQAAAGKGRRIAPRPGARDYEPLAREALGLQLERIWIQGHAAEVGVTATEREVSRLLAKIKRESFKNGAEYRRFVREFHYTRADIRERVKVQLLAAELQHRFERKSQREIREFINVFTQRWRARTVCAPDHAIDHCSNGPPLEEGPHIR
jgi:hypothetical protein